MRAVVQRVSQRARARRRSASPARSRADCLALVSVGDRRRRERCARDGRETRGLRIFADDRRLHEPLGARYRRRGAARLAVHAARRRPARAPPVVHRRRERAAKRASSTSSPEPRSRRAACAVAYGEFGAHMDVELVNDGTGDDPARHETHFLSDNRSACLSSLARLVLIYASTCGTKLSGPLLAL